MKILLTALLISLSSAAFAQCDTGIFIPATFDWNKMTDSTRFKPTFSGDDPDIYEFTIHDKWGVTLFQTNIPLQGWNGLMNNTKGNCAAGTYMWTLNCSWSADSVPRYCMGYVTCTGSRSVKVVALDTIHCRPSVYVPNTITPNGDGINEDFRPQFGCPPKNYAMQIFDRWGNLIFETKDPEKGWDGLHQQGSIAQQDTYVWKLSFSFFEGDKQRQIIGHVTLLR